MSMLGQAFHIVLYQPLFNALVFLYEYLPGKDFGVAIIVLTIALRFLMYPLSANAIRAQKTLARLQPKVQEIQERFSTNKEEATRRTLELYQKEHFNPFSAFFPLLAQFPLLIALYQVFRNGFRAQELSWLYPFVQNPGHFSHLFLGVLDLSEKSLPLALAAGLFQLIQSKQAMGLNPPQKNKGDAASMIQSQMAYAFPLVTIAITATLPAAIGLYWIATTLFSIWQQWYVMRERTNT